MRLLHIIAGGRHGGAERFFVDLAAAFARRGITQHAATRAYPDRLSQLSGIGCEVTTARMGGPFDVWSRRRIKRTAETFAPDICLAWMNRAALYSPVGPWSMVGRLGGYYDLKYYRACDHLICNTPDLVKHCTGHGWSGDRVDYIPNFSPPVNVSPVSRESLSTPKTAPLLLVLARLEDAKAVDVALRALTHFGESYLWIAGEGSKENALKKLAQSLGVFERVRFLGWRQDREALLKAADVCLVPSRHEPFGNVVVNAWSAGTPVVATASEGPSFLIQDEANGLLVPVDDPHALAAAVARVCGDQSLASTLSAGGSGRIAESFSEDIVASSYIRTFERLAGMPK